MHVCRRGGSKFFEDDSVSIIFIKIATMQKLVYLVSMLILTASTAVGQYSERLDEYGPMFALPQEGVLVIPFSSASPFNSSHVTRAYFSSLADTKIIRSDLAGGMHDATHLNNQLYLSNNTKFEIDVLYPEPVTITSVEADSAREIFVENHAAYTRHFQPVYIGSTHSESLVYTFDDTLFVLSPNFERDTFIVFTNVDVIGDVSSSANTLDPQELWLAATVASDRTRLIGLNADFTIGVDTTIAGDLHAIAEENGVSYLITTRHVFNLSSFSSLTLPYPAIEAVYDEGLALVITDGNSLYLLNDNEEFEFLADQATGSRDRIILQPEGWYTLSDNILTYSPTHPTFPTQNVLAISVVADSAVVVPLDSTPNGILVSRVRIHATLSVTNTSDAPVGSAEVVLKELRHLSPLAPRANFDIGADSLARGAMATKQVILGTIQYGPTLDPDLLGLSACIVKVNDQPVVEGVNLCAYARTDLVVDAQEAAVPATLRVYPNPASSTISFSGIERVTNLRILNMLGQVVYSGSITSAATVDVSNWPSGQYTVEAATDSSPSAKWHLQQMLIVQ